MAAFYTLELGGVSGTSGTVGSIDGLPTFKPSATNGHQARLRVSRGSYTLSATAITTSDLLNIAVIPSGSTFMYGLITSGVTLGSSTVGIGITGSTVKYRAQATFTAVDTPTPFGGAAAMAVQTPLAGDERIIGTIGGATMPATGQSLVIQMVYSNG